MRVLRISAVFAVLAAAAPMRTARAAEEVPAGIVTCFVPQQDCEGQIVGRIAAAARSIRVQAYGFSDVRIIDALDAAARRGVDVQVILDRSNVGRRRAVADAMLRRGIPVWVDGITGIAHTKAIIIDQDFVIGGSYNYTLAAQRRNAENVVFLHGAAVARRFLDNWDQRREASAMLAPEP